MIDAHQHYWQPQRGDYDWMPKGDPVLDKSYGPADLQPHLAAHGITHTVVVQAAASVNETEFMLGIAHATPSVAGVVGWVDFENKNDRQHLARLKNHPKFVGVRPMIQDIADVNWMMRSDIRWAFDALIELDLSFDALGFPVHSDNFLKLLSHYPDLRVVICHSMKPQIRDQMAGRDALGDWRLGMQRLASETQAFCKLSGLVTEAESGWTANDLRPFTDVVLDSFGPDRVMWGSDWPVCLLQSSYQRWLATARQLTEHFSAQQQARIFGETANAFYRLGI